MLPPWNKIEWGLPMAGRTIAIKPIGMPILCGEFDGTVFITGGVRFVPTQIEKWRYLDDVHAE